MTGFHSVMLNLYRMSIYFQQGALELTYPDSVNLVNPPNTTIPNTLAALPSNQYATDLELVLGKNPLGFPEGANEDFPVALSGTELDLALEEN